MISFLYNFLFPSLYKDIGEQEPDAIEQLYEENGEKKFVIKWKNSQKTGVMSTKLANLKYPQLVIEFYEKNLIIERDFNN